MAIQDIKLPKLGESIKEATLLNWLKKEGDTVEKDEVILEVATDKVDAEVAAPYSGIISKLLFQENDVVPIGEVIAKIDAIATDTTNKVINEEIVAEDTSADVSHSTNDSTPKDTIVERFDSNGRFCSPLVRSMAQKEGINQVELAAIKGSGNQGRLLKKDVQKYLNEGRQQKSDMNTKIVQTQSVGAKGTTEIIEMDRMRTMIANHMVESKRTSPHVTSYVEADVTNIVNWREKNKAAFAEKFGQKITFTPIFVEAVVKALLEFPLINVSVEGNKIIVKKDINIGLAAALPSGNLIVPVIKQADQKSLLGLTTEVNELVTKARTNKLKADEIHGSTFTISNVGTFRNVMGTPIINQPEVAILATGSIRKKPAVVETKYGDVIAIRQMMYLSLSFDHRVVDGNLGGSFLARIGDFLEEFDESRAI